MKGTNMNPIGYDMSFSQALDALKSGTALGIQRLGWNGKDLVVRLRAATKVFQLQLPYLYIEYPKNHPSYPDAQCPWLASQTDILSDDWGIVEWGNVDVRKAMAAKLDEGPRPETEAQTDRSSNALRPGTVVRLASGGPPMTIESLREEFPFEDGTPCKGPSATCLLIHGAYHEIRRHNIALAALVKYPDPAVEEAAVGPMDRVTRGAYLRGALQSDKKPEF
jgi:hypothetical protein